jgi:hypothetical protein
LDDLATSPSELLIAGDFNIHVDEPSASFSTIFLKLLDSFSLTQHINFSTHNSKHILDLFITRSSFTDILSIVSLDPAVSDHLAQLITINVPPHARRSRTTKLIRCFRKLDHKLFSQEILASPLCTIPPAILDSISVETYLHLFDHTLTSLLDKHVPLKSVTCPSREQKPYITPHIINEKRQRSKLETIYRRRKTTENLLNYKAQAQLVAKLITQGKRTYFKKLVTDCETQPKKLWSTLQTLLSRSTPPILPNSISSSNLAKRFITFFDQKVVKLCASISKIQLVSSTHQTKTSPPPPSLSAFSPATPEEIRNIVLTSSNASCLLDSIPTFLLKSCLDSLLNPITTVINKALQDGFFPTTFKTANIYPLLKKHNLPHEELSSYRPISNLNFISKVLERVIQTRLNSHLSTFPSICRFQSAYRKFHSTETALLRIHNDISLAINQQR